MSFLNQEILESPKTPKPRKHQTCLWSRYRKPRRAFLAMHKAPPLQRAISRNAAVPPVVSSGRAFDGTLPEKFIKCWLLFTLMIRPYDKKVVRLNQPIKGKILNQPINGLCSTFI